MPPYDQAAPDGVSEIELDREGTILQMAASVSVDELPGGALDAAMRQFPGAAIQRAEREVHESGWLWAVQLAQQGREVEAICDESGNLHVSEKEIARSEAPRPVRAAADRVVPGGELKSVQVVEHAGCASTT